MIKVELSKKVSVR